MSSPGTTRHTVSLTEEHRERLKRAFPMANVTDMIVASSLRGIEAVEVSCEEGGGNQ